MKKIKICILSAVWFLLSPSSVVAQMGMEQYDHQQFCEDEFFTVAAPSRATIVYLDASHVYLEDMGVNIAATSDLSSNREWLREASSRYGSTDWYAQLKGKLESSLLPSERVMVVLLFPAEGRAQELMSSCWPGYTEAQEANMEEASFLKKFFTADQRQFLEDQRSVFFGDIRIALVEAMAEAKIRSNPRQSEYVRAFSMDEARLGGGLLDLRVRMILLGEFLENSDLGSVREALDPQMLAREAARTFGYNARGASVHLYGASSGVLGQKAQIFWDEFFHEATGHLMSFGTELSMSAQPPAHFQQVNLEISLGSSEQTRTAELNLAVSSHGELQDSIIIVGQQQRRSKVNGTFQCQSGPESCRSRCEIEVEISRPVLVESDQLSGSHEKIVLSGFGDDLTGSFGLSGAYEDYFEASGWLAECADPWQTGL